MNRERMAADLKRMGFGDEQIAEGLGQLPAEQNTPGKPWAPFKNKMEMLYSKELEYLHNLGRFSGWRYEAITFHTLGGHGYKPDFLVVRSGNLYFIETKGFARSKDIIRFDEVRAAFPMFAFMMVGRDKSGWRWTRGDRVPWLPGGEQ